MRLLAKEVQHALAVEKQFRDLLIATYKSVPRSAHVQMETIHGIGAATAAVLLAKMGDINRFATPDAVVSYFGVFPEEVASGVDKRGRPIPPGTMCMSRKGNDLVRCYLWNAARVAIRCNPAVRALYHRLRARGKRGDVALGHCMRKLLHLVFAVWKTDRPFDKNHFPWEGTGAESPSATACAPASPNTATSAAACAEAIPSTAPLATACTEADASTAASANDKAVGHKRDMPAEKVVTTAACTPEPAAPAVKPTAPAQPLVDFAFLREQITMEQVLDRLGLSAGLKGSGPQRRGSCPVHGQPGDGERIFSVNLRKNLFQCFFPGCGIKGNALDLWAAIHRLPLYEAALHLAATFHLACNREEEPVRHAGARTKPGRRSKSRRRPSRS